MMIVVNANRVWELTLLPSTDDEWMMMMLLMDDSLKPQYCGTYNEE
jgi:hypothetical protein